MRACIRIQLRAKSANQIVRGGAYVPIPCPALRVVILVTLLMIARRTRTNNYAVKAAQGRLRACRVLFLLS